jgi:hypothetical protein
MSKILINVSLRVWHPTMRGSTIAEKLDFAPKFVHNVGERRVTPAGNMLEGNHENSYVAMPLVRKVEVELDEELVRWCSILEKHVAFLHELKDTGGKLEFYVSAFLSGLGGFELDNLTLQRIQTLGLGVAIELYPEE